LQADGFGNIGTVYNCSGTSVNLANEFSGFLTNAYTALGGNIVFNAVGQYGQQQIATNADLAFLYTECWPFLGQTTYDDLQTAINNNNTWSSGAKASVLAAYPDQTTRTASRQLIPDSSIHPACCMRTRPSSRPR